MKKYYLITILWCIFVQINFCFGLGPNFAWVKQNQNGFYDKVTTSPTGQVYGAGNFSSSTLTLGSVTLNHISFTTDEDIFVVKLNASGTVQWARAAGGNYQDHVASIKSDQYGNVYVAGYFKSYNIVFGTYTLQNANATEPDIFIVKYDSLGNVRWAKRLGGQNFEHLGGLALDSSGNVYLTGDFNSNSISVGSTILNLTLTPSCTGCSDFFVTKMDSVGNIIWVRQGKGKFSEESISIAIDHSNNPYVSGTTSSDTLIFNTDTLFSPGTYFVKLDPGGNIIWVKNDSIVRRDMFFDSNNNIWSRDRYTSASVIFGNDTLGNSNPGVENGCIVKQDSLGNVILARAIDGTREDVLREIGLDSDDGIIGAGYFTSDTLRIGSLKIRNLSTASSTPDVFLFKYDSSGALLWAKTVGGTQNEYGINLAVDRFGNGYVSGEFYSPTLNFGVTTLNYSNGSNFLAKLKGCSLSQPVITFSTGALQSTLATGYQWQLNGVNIPGATAQLFTPTQAGLYTVVVSNPGGCSVTSAGYPVIALGIADLDPEAHINIFPNPTSRNAQLTITSKGRIKEVEIFNASGSMMHAQPGAGNSLNMEFHEPGIYFVRVITNSVVIVKRLVVTP